MRIRLLNVHAYDLILPSFLSQGVASAAGRRQGEERWRRCLLREPEHNSASTGPQLGRLPVYVKLKRRHVSLCP